MSEVREEKQENLEEILKNIEKAEKRNKPHVITDAEKKESELALEFLKMIDEINLSSKNYRSIFVEGEEELLYDDGEFFICSATDSKKTKKKKTRKEATELYIEYFIRYQLNPIIEQKNIDSITKNIVKDINEKETKTKEIRESVRSQLKEEVSSSMKRNTVKPVKKGMER